MKTLTPGQLILFWDFDAQWGAERSRAPGGEKSWGGLDFINTEQLLEIHARFRIPACFAIVGAAALPGERPRHDPALVRRIVEHGHEVASHSMRHEWLPGLGYEKLIRTLQDSKDALQQATGCPVVSFVPPYNQPFEYLPKGSLSISERKLAGRDRIDLGRLCRALNETGYRFCRVAYSPWYERIRMILVRRRGPRPSMPETIAGITCLRTSAAAGFREEALTLLDRCAQTGGIAVISGHPHSLHTGMAQDERLLVPFLEQARRLIDDGRLTVLLPQQLIQERIGK
jgi:peptidoglycan/xylan/chitin deacetylase (PgdA/CDA1 family)